MKQISLTEFRRRFACGYKFVLNSEDQTDSRLFCIPIIQEYENVFISFDPDVIVLSSPSHSGMLKIGAISHISSHEQENGNLVSLMIAFRRECVSYDLNIVAVKLNDKNI